MTLVKCSDKPETYLNMDYIEYVTKFEDGETYAFINGLSYKISEKAYNIILNYGKAKI